MIGDNLTNISKNSVYKFLVLGDHQTGKTQALKYFCEGKNNIIENSTIGCEIHIKQIETDNNNITSFLEFWDMSGQESHRNFSKIYFNHLFKEDMPKGLIYFFDVEKDSTLHEIHSFLRELDIYLFEKQIPLLIIGNNFDNLTNSNSGKICLKLGDYLKPLFGTDTKIYLSYFSKKNFLDTANDINCFIKKAINNEYHNLLAYKPGMLKYTHEKLREQAEEQFSNFKGKLKQIPSRLVSIRLLSIILAVIHQKLKF